MSDIRQATLLVEQVSAQDDWDDYVAAHDQATQAHLWGWRDVLSAELGHEPHYLVAREHGGGLRGVLPLLRVRSRLFGDFLVSVPALNYGGVLASDEEADAALVDGAATLAATLQVSHAELRETRPREGLPVRTDKVAMELELPSSVDELMKAVGTKVRAQVKRPVREGASAVVGGPELLDEFYAVFSRNMRDLGTPVYARSLFASVLGSFGDQARIHVVRMACQPVAAGFVLGYRQRLEIPWASSLREFNRAGVNMLLYAEVLKGAIERGFRRFDFGRSSVDSGTFRFKQQWGAKPRQLYWHYWLRPGTEMPGLTPSNPKYSVAIRMWQKLPVSVANVLGPLLVRGLP